MCSYPLDVSAIAEFLRANENNILKAECSETCLPISSDVEMPVAEALRRIEQDKELVFAESVSGRRIVLSIQNTLFRFTMEEESSPDRALLEAAARGEADGVKSLLDLGADVNATDATTGRTALMLAIDSLYPVSKARRSEIAKVLLAKGAEPAPRDKKGRSALDLARTRDLREVATRLLGENAG